MAAVTAAFAVFGAYTAWQGALPVIEIEVLAGASAEEATAPTFIVKNTGAGDAAEVGWNCGTIAQYNRSPGAIWRPEAEVIGRRLTRPELYIGRLPAGGHVIRRCVGATSQPGFRQTTGSFAIPIVTYNSLFAPWPHNKTVFFESSLNGAGETVWLFVSENLTREEAERMRKEGYSSIEIPQGGGNLVFTPPAAGLPSP